MENAIQHTQTTALKGRKFESIEEQNAWLAHWEERWAAPRIHGRKKRQVLQMYLEEKPSHKPRKAFDEKGLHLLSSSLGEAACGDANTSTAARKSS